MRRCSCSWVSWAAAATEALSCSTRSPRSSSCLLKSISISLLVASCWLLLRSGGGCGARRSGRCRLGQATKAQAHGDVRDAGEQGVVADHEQDGECAVIRDEDEEGTEQERDDAADDVQPRAADDVAKPDRGPDLGDAADDRERADEQDEGHGGDLRADDGVDADRDAEDARDDEQPAGSARRREAQSNREGPVDEGV